MKVRAFQGVCFEPRRNHIGRRVNAKGSSLGSFPGSQHTLRASRLQVIEKGQTFNSSIWEDEADRALSSMPAWTPGLCL